MRQPAVFPAEKRPTPEGLNRCWIDERPRSGRENMEIDWALLSRAEREERPGVWVRFYGWERPTVSLGKHQSAAAAVDLDCCREWSIPIVHRPTGGRAVLHDDELTYAVASNDASRFPLGSVTQTYLAVARALQFGLRELGVETEMARGGGAERRAAGSPSPCFAAVSRHELLAEGRKIAGSAQRRLRRSFLQHGSLPLSIDYRLTARVLKSDPELLKARMLGLREALPGKISFVRLAQSLKLGFERTLNVDLLQGPNPIA